jgi:hypothetical protein
MNDFLRDLWEENLYPSKAKLLKLAKETKPETKAKDIDIFLDAQIAYQMLKENKNVKSNIGHIVAFKINEIWQMDIYDVSRYEKSNKGFKYMFAVVDVFTRFAYIIPLKNKDIISTTQALKEILNQNKTRPNLIISDNDSSFLGEMFQKLLTENNIHHSPNAVGDHQALGIIDSFAKRIKRILNSQFLMTKNKTWIDNIQKIIKKYNNSKLNSIGGDITPQEAMNDDKDINELLFLINLLKSQKNNTGSDLSIGDLVRTRITDGFRKGTDPRYSGEVFEVKEINGKNIILDNDKKYVRINLLKVPAGTVSDTKPNIIDKAKKDHKVNQLLKSNGHTDPILVARLRKQKLDREAKKLN